MVDLGSPSPLRGVERIGPLDVAFGRASPAATQAGSDRSTGAEQGGATAGA